MFLTVIVSEKAKKGRDKSYTEPGAVSSLLLGTDLHLPKRAGCS